MTAADSHDTLFARWCEMWEAIDTRPDIRDVFPRREITAEEAAEIDAKKESQA